MRRKRMNEGCTSEEEKKGSRDTIQSGEGGKKEERNQINTSQRRRLNKNKDIYFKQKEKMKGES